MSVQEPQASGPVGRVITQLTYLLACAVALVGICSGAGLVIALFMKVLQANPEHNEPSATGPAMYASASALLAALTVGAICASLVLMSHPEYGHCRGSRVSPDEVPERIFVYTARIVDYWASAWEMGRVDEGTARRFARGFFGGDVPLRYWQRFGGRDGRHGVRRLAAIFDEEFQRAVKSHSPLRAYEPPGQPDRASRTTPSWNGSTPARWVWHMNTADRTGRYARNSRDPSNSSFFMNSRKPRQTPPFDNNISPGA